jgi:hypothetical protein
MTTTLHAAPICPYCGAPARLVDDVEIYKVQTYGRKMWLCAPCDAYVGIHKDSSNHAPLGRLAKKPLRLRKIEAHRLLDALWRAAMQHRGWSKGHARRTAYRWLANRMGIGHQRCHIGYFDEAQTELCITICAAVHAQAAASVNNPQPERKEPCPSPVTLPPNSAA